MYKQKKILFLHTLSHQHTGGGTGRLCPPPQGFTITLCLDHELSLNKTSKRVEKCSCDLLSSVCVTVVNDVQRALCRQVTPAPCRLSWSWKKPCASTNSTKTRSSSSTVSLAGPGTVMSQKHFLNCPGFFSSWPQTHHPDDLRSLTFLLSKVSAYLFIVLHGALVGTGSQPRSGANRRALGCQCVINLQCGCYK